MKRVTRARRCEAEFLFQLTFHGNQSDHIDSKRKFEVKPRRNLSGVFSKSLDDCNGVTRNRVVGRPGDNCEESNGPHHRDALGGRQPTWQQATHAFATLAENSIDLWWSTLLSGVPRTSIFRAVIMIRHVVFLFF